MSNINIENPTITIEVDNRVPDANKLKLLYYQCDLALLWFLSFYNHYTTKHSMPKSTVRTDLDSYKIPILPGFNSNLFNLILRYQTHKKTKDTGVYGSISNLGTSIASMLAPLGNCTLSCSEQLYGTFSTIQSFTLGYTELKPHNIKAKLFATFLLFYSLSKIIYRQGACLIHTTMVKGGGYEFYYEVLAKYNLAITELTYVNTNTGRTLSAVDYLTWDITDKICNGGLDLEELFLLPDYLNSKDCHEYLFKNLDHSIEHLFTK